LVSFKLEDFFEDIFFVNHTHFLSAGWRINFKYWIPNT
jgi:hypothetical protein